MDDSSYDEQDTSDTSVDACATDLGLGDTTQDDPYGDQDSGAAGDVITPGTADIELPQDTITPSWSQQQQGIDQDVDPLVTPMTDALHQGGQSDPIQWPEPDPSHDPIFGPSAGQ